MPEEDKKPEVDPVEKMESFLKNLPEHLSDKNALTKQYGEDKYDFIIKERDTAIKSTIKAWKIVHDETRKTEEAEQDYATGIGTILVYQENNPDLPYFFSDEENEAMTQYLDIIDRKIFKEE